MFTSFKITKEESNLIANFLFYLRISEQVSRHEAFIKLEAALRRRNWNRDASELKLMVEGGVGQSDITPQGKSFCITHT